MSRLHAEHLYKVFGRRPDEAVRRLEAGADRDELRADGTTAAVIDASFSVEPGQIFVVMGLSGSGKSTLLRMLNGLLEPTSGRVLFDGQDLTALGDRDLRRVRSHRISMVFQHFALFPHRSVLENAAYGLEVQGVPRAERERRAGEALELCGLGGWAKSWPDELSGGMQQRVGLARALATDADLLLMDESFSALDPLIRRDMQDQLLELQKRLKKTIVFITHDLNEAMRLGDRIAVMRDGRIVQLGSAEDILVRPANDYVASFIQDVDRSRVLTAGAVMEPVETVLGTPAEPGAPAESGAPAEPGTPAESGGPARSGRQARTAADQPRTAADVLAAAPAAVPAATPLAELFGPCAGSAAPVAVTDEAGGLAGVVTRARLFAALADGAAPGTGPGTGATTAPEAEAEADAQADAQTGAEPAGRKEVARA
ncbi:glycine betaine/L-proline ABC transporter ATP-binding protein [Streptomyces sp. NPDC015131]|uniref:quaternary amine ABC transporter ATP-binding protein n=1 Tax=Streptomyces sp. NPDC015131 TaxID=3364941 RepID=UPI0036F5A3C3